MSPRRRITAGHPDFFAVRPRPPRWGLTLLGALAGVLIPLAVAAATFVLVEHESDRRTATRDVAVLDYVTEFMTEYTSLDPFNANDYADGILEEATGEFAKMFEEKKNAILVQVARAEPTTGEVLAAGIERWHDDGSADVLVAVKTTTKTPDGKRTIESGSRWLATAVKKGQQWKISNLIQVI